MYLLQEILAMVAIVGLPLAAGVYGAKKGKELRWFVGAVAACVAVIVGIIFTF